MSSTFPELPASGGISTRGGDRSSLDRVAAALDAMGLPSRNHRGTSFMARCPVHDDSSPSLHVTWRQGANGGYTLLKCFGCNAGAEDLTAAMGLTLADLFDEPLPPSQRLGRAGKTPAQRRAGRRRGRLGRLPESVLPAPKPEPEIPEQAWNEIRRYPYEDLKGNLVQEVIREECVVESVRRKRFRQEFVTAGRRVKRRPADFYPVLYRARQVRDGVAAGKPIWLVEGEKDVEAAEQLGLVATTNAQGGKSFPDELIDCLAEAVVRVVLDRDATGWARGVELHRKLTAARAKVTLLVPAVEQAKADLSDHLEQGLSIGELLEVDVEEVAAWLAVTDARAKAVQVERAIAEADAHGELAEANPDKSEEHRTRATRWAMESQIRHEALLVAVDEVHAHALRVGTVWAGQAIEEAERLRASVTLAARTCHQRAGVPVPPSLRANDIATEPNPPQHTSTAGPGDTRGALAVVHAVTPPVTDDDVDLGHQRGLAVTAPVFRILNGMIVQVEEPRGRAREEGSDEAFKVVFGTVVRMVAREYLEPPEESEVDPIPLMGRADTGRSKPRTPRRLSAVRLEYPDPATGEWVEIRVDADSWHDHSWIESIPGRPDHDPRRAGKEVLQRAIVAVSPNARDEVIYRSTGWRLLPNGEHGFVHARGMVTSEGHLDCDVHLSGSMTRYDLPDPTSDPSQLRKAFLEHSAGMLQRLPDRVAAPILGHVYRSAIGRNPWLLALVGSPASYKTSTAAKLMHHWGERWDHDMPGSSMSGNGDTVNAIRLKLGAGKDVLSWLDDFAPTKGWATAQALLEETGRLQYNAEARDRSTRDGQGLIAGTPPRGSAIATSEVMPRPGSGGQRMLVVPLRQTDVDTAKLFPLNEPDSRYGRALVMSTFLSWLARDLLTHRTRYATAEADYASRLGKDGATVRDAAAVAATWAGWVAITDAMIDLGAITPEEAQALLERVDAALVEAGQAAVDPDQPRSTGPRVLSLISYALEQGIAHVDCVRTGDAPPWPLAGRLGWRRTAMETGVDGSIKWRFDRQGARAGYVLHDPGPRERGRVLMCTQEQLEAVIKAASATQTEKLEIDKATALRALDDAGHLFTDRSENKTRFTIKCQIYAENRTARLVAIRLDDILGPDENDPDATTDPQDGPASDDPGGPSGSGGAGGSGHPGDDGTDGAAIVEPLFPLEGDPQPMDRSGRDREDEAVADHDNEGDDQTRESDDMTDFTFASRQIFDAEDTEGWTGMLPAQDLGPCALCGLRCGVTVNGERIHLPCFERSTAAERHDHSEVISTRPAAANPEPRTSATPAPNATTNATPAGQARRAQAPAARTAPKWRATAAVADVDGLWLSNGEHLELPAQPRHLGDLVDLAHELRLGTQVTKYLAASGQIWVGAELAARMGVDTQAISDASPHEREEVTRKVTHGTPVVTEALAAGYSIGGRDSESMGRWTRAWKGSEKPVRIVLLPALGADPEATPLLLDEPTHQVLARRLDLFAEALGAPYELSGSTTGLDLMRSLRWRDRDKLFAPYEAVPPALISSTELDHSWCRKPTAEELEHKYLVAFDRSGSYLAGVSGLELGIGEPEHHPDGRSFDPKLPGYWMLQVPEAGDWRQPHPLDPRGSKAGRLAWVTTPSLAFAAEQGYDPEVVEAYVWTEHSRILDPWYERIRDARSRLDTDDPDAQIARDQLKAVYASTIGMLGSQTYMAGRPCYAPERRHHIIAKSRTNILRRIAQIGADTDRWPVAVTTDTVVYTSPTSDPIQAWPGGAKWWGRELGRYKHEATCLLEDGLPHLTGGLWRGKDPMVEAYDRMRAEGSL